MEMTSISDSDSATATDLASHSSVLLNLPTNDADGTTPATRWAYCWMDMSAATSFTLVGTVMLAE